MKHRLTGSQLRVALAAPAPAEGFVSRLVPVDGIRLHVRQRRATGPVGTPLILLHGLAVSHRYLMPTAREIRGRDVYVPDLPGFGLSSKPTGALDVGGHATVLATWLNSRIGRPVTVVGHSFGCQVAVELAHRHPDVVSALILVGPTTDPAAATAAGQLRRLLPDLPHEDLRQAAILWTDIRDAGPRRILRTLRYAVRDPMAAKLPAISVPTLFVRGADDPIASARWLERAASSLPGARTLTIDGAAHNAATTAGPQLAAAIEDFCRHRDPPRRRSARRRDQQR
jgi:pimeloyl-ACP methyl ester carboxylesterase